jgi:hypothetical protein
MLKITIWLCTILLAVNVVAALAAPGSGPDPPMGYLLVGVGALFVAFLWGLVLGGWLIWRWGGMGVTERYMVLCGIGGVVVLYFLTAAVWSIFH